GPPPPPQPPPQTAPAAPSPAAAAALPTGDAPTRDQLTKAWGDAVLVALPRKAQARFGAGRFVATDAGTAVFALPNAMHRDRCEEVRPEVESVLAAHFGRPVPLRLVVEATDTVAPEAPPGVLDPAEEDVRVEELRDAPEAAVTSPEDRLKQAFGNLEEVDPT
ncbi:MAG: polymerase subunit gamma/tau, partial [Acidimicrobiaceae bacterium]|nr:polymerase subunit gamma/tau [Acidimicrobiaceae bacterium]